MNLISLWRYPLGSKTAIKILTDTSCYKVDYHENLNQRKRRGEIEKTSNSKSGHHDRYRLKFKKYLQPRDKIFEETQPENQYEASNEK